MIISKDELKKALGVKDTYVGGTVMIASGSTTVLGSGTTFENDFIQGDTIYLLSDGDEFAKEVIQIVSNTEMTLIEAYSGNAESGIAKKENPDSDQLASIASRVDAFVKTYTGRNFEEQNYQVVFDGYGKMMYFIECPITDTIPFKLEVNNGTPNTPVWVEVSAEDYALYREEGKINYYFTSGVQNYRITCSAGYETVPNELKQSCIDIASSIYNTSSKKGIQSESWGSHSISFQTNAIQNASAVSGIDFLGILDMYRPINLGGKEIIFLR